MVKFWHSLKPFDCGWYAEVIFVPVILCKLSPTWFTDSLLWSFISILIHPCRQMISYKNFATVGADLSLQTLASDHFEKSSIHKFKCSKTSTSGSLQRSIFFNTSLGIDILCNFCNFSVYNFSSFRYTPLYPQPCYASKVVQ